MSSRSNLMRLALVLAVVVTWNMAAQGQEGTEMVKADENVLFFDDFSEGMDNWWSEGGVRVWVEDETRPVRYGLVQAAVRRRCQDRVRRPCAAVRH